MINEEKQNRTVSATTLAAGTYLVGDPCYAFANNPRPAGPDDQWSAWLDDAWKDVDPNRVRILDGRVDGMRIVASGTAYGDGGYLDQDGFVYGVDAGLLGAVHIKFIANLHPEHAGKTEEELEAALGMRVVEFTEPFTVSYTNGLVQIGHIRINTL